MNINYGYYQFNYIKIFGQMMNNENIHPTKSNIIDYNLKKSNLKNYTIKTISNYKTKNLSECKIVKDNKK